MLSFKEYIRHKDEVSFKIRENQILDSILDKFIFFEMAAEMGSRVVRAKILWDSEDIAYLSQFPTSLWPFAFTHRYTTNIFDTWLRNQARDIIELAEGSNEEKLESTIEKLSDYGDPTTIRSAAIEGPLNFDFVLLRPDARVRRQIFFAKTFGDKLYHRLTSEIDLDAAEEKSSNEYFSETKKLHSGATVPRNGLYNFEIAFPKKDDEIVMDGLSLNDDVLRRKLTSWIELSQDGWLGDIDQLPEGGVNIFRKEQQYRVMPQSAVVSTNVKENSWREKTLNYLIQSAKPFLATRGINPDESVYGSAAQFAKNFAFGEQDGQRLFPSMMVVDEGLTSEFNPPVASHLIVLYPTKDIDKKSVDRFDLLKRVVESAEFPVVHVQKLMADSALREELKKHNIDSINASNFHKVKEILKTVAKKIQETAKKQDAFENVKHGSLKDPTPKSGPVVNRKRTIRNPGKADDQTKWETIHRQFFAYDQIEETPTGLKVTHKLPYSGETQEGSPIQSAINYTVKKFRRDMPKSVIEDLKEAEVSHVVEMFDLLKQYIGEPIFAKYFKIYDAFVEGQTTKEKLKKAYEKCAERVKGLVQNLLMGRIRERAKEKGTVARTEFEVPTREPEHEIDLRSDMKRMYHKVLQELPSQRPNPQMDERIFQHLATEHGISRSDFETIKNEPLIILTQERYDFLKDSILRFALKQGVPPTDERMLRRLVISLTTNLYASLVDNLELEITPYLEETLIKPTVDRLLPEIQKELDEKTRQVRTAVPATPHPTAVPTTPRPTPTATPTTPRPTVPTTPPPKTPPVRPQTQRTLF